MTAATTSRRREAPKRRLHRQISGDSTKATCLATIKESPSTNEVSALAQVRDLLRCRATHRDGVSHGWVGPDCALSGACWLGTRTSSFAEAPDRNADAKIVEIDLRAELADVQIAPGKTVHAWTYDGRLPGPLIRTHVGDRLIVHFQQRPAGAHDGPLARRARADRDGRRARHFATRSQAAASPSPTTSSCAMPGCIGITRT